MNSTRVATAAPNSATPLTVCNALSAVLIIPFWAFLLLLQFLSPLSIQKLSVDPPQQVRK